MTITTKTADELSLELVKSHLVVSDTYDDIIIAQYQKASLDKSELYLSKPITTEIWNSITETKDFYSFEIPYKPTVLELLLDGSVISVLTDYSYTYSSIEFTTDIIFDEIKATVESCNNDSIVAARLLDIGTLYASRENETYSHKLHSNSSNFLHDLNQGSIF